MHVDGTKPVIQRLDRFDLLRGISILLVVFDHAQQVLQFHDQAPGRKMPIVLHRLLFESGPLGVWIFFSISGFLITMTSIRRFRSLQQLRPAAFYRIRFARIAPTLLAVLAVMSLLHLEHAPYFIVAPAFGSLRGALFAALTFQINWLQSLHGWLPLGWLILWSLSVEEMFYLFFPLGCALLRKKMDGAHSCHAAVDPASPGSAVALARLQRE